MFGLTPLGELHTAVSLVAVGAGLAALVRDKAISFANGLGKVYVAATVVVCLTAFGIVRHGGFGGAHVLAGVTLLVLALAAVADRSKLFGRAGRYIATIGFSATFLFHIIPAVVEITTRLPLDAPLVVSADAPALKVATAGLIVAFLVGAAFQVRRLHRTGSP
jgi:uncharacterized membrane protein